MCYFSSRASTCYMCAFIHDMCIGFLPFSAHVTYVRGAPRSLVGTDSISSGLGSKSKLCDWSTKQGLNPTGRSLPCSFHGFRVENVSLWMSQPLLCCWWTPESWRCRSKIERCIGTSCILDVPKDDHAIPNNKDATIDSSTRKMKSLQSAGRMRHYSSKTDTTDWCTLRRVSKW